MEDDAVLLRILVMKEKETVMDVVMEVLMMVMKGAREILCVAAKTASSLVFTTMIKTTAVRNEKLFPVSSTQKLRVYNSRGTQ